MSGFMDKLPLLEGLLARVAQTAGLLWEKGWAEANGGNLSIDVTETLGAESASLKGGDEIGLPVGYPSLADRLVLVTGSGRRFRECATDPASNLCLLRINGTGDGYSLIWGGEGEPPFTPTSELPSHLRIHEHHLEVGSANRVMLHTHPDNLIALTHLPPEAFPNPSDPPERRISLALWGMLPEVKVLVPRGMGFARYRLPGSEKMARETLDVLGQGFEVLLWEMHGCLATAPDVATAFDRIDVLEKAAGIYLTCLNAGYRPKGMSNEQLLELSHAFDLDDNL